MAIVANAEVEGGRRLAAQPTSLRRIAPLVGRRSALSWALHLLLLGGVAGWADLSFAETSEAPLRQRVRKWVLELDARRFIVRQAAYQKLVQQGQPVIAELQRLPKEKLSAEQRTRIKHAVGEIQEKILDEGFRKLVGEKDGRIDFEQAMWLVACLVDPSVEKKKLDAQILQLTKRVEKQLGAAPAKASPKDVVAAIQQVVFRDFGLLGDRRRYDEPENSSLDFVLREKRGLPILLSHVAIAIGERLKLPLVGVPMPGRYMFKYDGASAPQGHPKQDIIVDAFGGGQILSEEELQKLIGLNGERFLRQTTRREVVSRMLRNLESDFEVVGKLEHAWRVRKYHALVGDG